jgi:hypothetical protein
MARRAALALVRTPPLRPALPRALVPSRRTVALALAVVGLAGLAYLGARQTAVFAFESAKVTGAPPGVAADVRTALRPLEGTSLVALDPDDVEDLLAGVPTVRAAHVDRAFPHGLAIQVEPERALAVFRDGPKAWLVAETGRVLRPLDPTARPKLPRIRVEVTRTPAVGGALPGEDVGDALAVLAALSTRPPRRTASCSRSRTGPTSAWANRRCWPGSSPPPRPSCGRSRRRSGSRWGTWTRASSSASSRGPTLNPRVKL